MTRCPACNRPLVTTASGPPACANPQCVGLALAHGNAIAAAARPGAARLVKALVRHGLDPAAVDTAAQLALILDEGTER